MKYSVALLSTLAVLVVARDIKARAPTGGHAVQEYETVVEEEVKEEAVKEKEGKEEVKEEAVKEKDGKDKEGKDEKDGKDKEGKEEVEHKVEEVEHEYEEPTSENGHVTEHPEDWIHTVYATEVKTVTDCPEETTDCPADKHYTTTVVVAVSTTVCPPEEWTHEPYHPTTHYEEPCPETTHYEEPCPDTTTYVEHSPEETWTPSWTSEYHQPTESSYPCDNEYDCPAAPVEAAPVEKPCDGYDCPAVPVETPVVYDEENSGVDYEEPVVTAGASAARVGGALVAAAVAALLL